MKTLNHVINTIKESGLTLRFVEEQLGAYRGKLTDFKNGKTSLSESELIKIAKLCNKTLDYLTTGEQKEKPDTVDGIELSEQEWDIINFFRGASPEVKAMFVQLSKTK